MPEHFAAAATLLSTISITLLHLRLLVLMPLSLLAAPVAAAAAAALLQESGKQFISANVPVELSHTKGYFEARALTPGNKYFISVVGK
jgi:hypothetical protein